MRTPVGDAAPAILEAAAAAGADLIVIGTQGLGGLHKWLVGSTTERLLRQTRVPVLAVPPRDDRQLPSPASFPTSSAPLTSATLPSSRRRWPRILAAAFSARLTLAHVVEPLTVPAQWQPIASESDDTRVAAARTKLDAIAAQACGAATCDTVVVLGRPAELIGSIAADRGAQVIAMGLAGAHGAFAPRPGSIAYRVLSSTMIPVLAVPAARR